jgi:RNA-directed DNA polymerase
MVILSGSKKSAERKFVSIARFIEQKLFLKIRKDKTKIPKACEETQFIGFAFTGRLTVMKRISHAKILSSCPRKKRFQLIESINEMLDVRAKG